jgi:ABC-type spermidine/putrescine transport system permease subunit II
MNASHKYKIIFKPWLLLAPALLPGVFVLGIGLIKALQSSLGWMPALGMKNVSLDAYLSLFKENKIRIDFLYTLFFASISVTITLLIGSLIAWGLVSVRNKYIKYWGSAWLILAVILPYGIAALATQSFLGQSGLLARIAATLKLIQEPSQFPVLLLTPFGLGLFWPYIWKGSAFTAMVLRPYYEKVRNIHEAEARTLGVGGLTIWSSVYLPAGAGALAFISSVLFAYILGGLEIPVWLGALSPKIISADYYSLFLQPDINRIPERMALVIIMAFVGLISSIVFGFFVFKVARNGLGYRYFIRAAKATHVNKNRDIGNSQMYKKIINCFIVIYGFLMGVPFIWLLVTGQNPGLRFPCFIPSNWYIFSNLFSIIKEPLLAEAVKNSLIVASWTGLFSSFAGLTAGRAFVKYKGFKGERLAQVFCYIPLIIPGIVIVTGAQLSTIIFGFYGTKLAVILCHLMFTIPYAVGIQTIYQKQNGILHEEAARTLGARPKQFVMKILIPMSIPSLVMSFTLSFLISFTETFSTQLVGGGRVTTLGALLGPVLEYGDMTRGSSYMLLFMLINSLVFYISYMMTKKMITKSEHHFLEDN